MNEVTDAWSSDKSTSHSTKLMRQNASDENMDQLYARRPSITLLPPAFGSSTSPTEEDTIISRGTSDPSPISYKSMLPPETKPNNAVKEPPEPFLDLDNTAELRKQLQELASQQQPLGKNILRDARSYPFFCENCEWETDSKVKSVPKKIAWITGTCIAVMGCFCGCCCLPCAFDPFFDVSHTCPDCDEPAGPPPSRYVETDYTWDWPPI